MGLQNNIASILEGHHLVPVITFKQGDNYNSMMDFLISQGVKCIEITLRTPEGLKAIKKLKKEYPSEILIGAGTVTTEAQVEQLKSIGTDFIVSPGLTPNLKVIFENSGIPYLPGVATPSEVMNAREMGLNTLKFFPADLYGGIKALKAFGNLFPDVKFCPTGGINKETSTDYLALNNVFAVGGSWFQADYQKEKNI
mgnify:CR=1 FL=1